MGKSAAFPWQMRSIPPQALRLTGRAKLMTIGRFKEQARFRAGMKRGSPREGSMKRAKFTLAAAAAAAAIAVSAPVSKAQAQDFYKGKTITIIVGYTPGGGFDANARLLARYLGRHIPGNPDVVVTNMPGASSLTSVLYLDTTAPKDGTFIDIFNFGAIGDSKMGVTPLKIDFRNYNWVGSISQDITACYMWHALGIKTIADAKAHGLLHFGLTGVGTSNDINQKILKNIFGLNIQQVTGYPGSAEEKIAIESGEIDGDCGAWSSVPADWVAKRDIVPIIKTSPVTPPDMPPDVPYAIDIAPTPHDVQIIRLLVSSGNVGRPFIASRAVPADRMKILRDGFDATVKDPDFLADAAKQRLPIAPKNAAEALKTVDDIYATPDDVVAAARKIAGE
jgi:tripartite-type tricarboxylate transporter receptor subunit TctC